MHVGACAARRSTAAHHAWVALGYRSPKPAQQHGTGLLALKTHLKHGQLGCSQLNDTCRPWRYDHCGVFTGATLGMQVQAHRAFCSLLSCMQQVCT
jgi:hypothetical protein